MSFAWPVALVGLVALPLLIRWYGTEQRRRERAAAAFVTAPLRPSVAPRAPHWQRHVPTTAALIGAAVLIVAAARPQRTVAVPLTDGAVMLVDDTSSSMAATDVAPSRLGAAQRAANVFLEHLPSSVRVGMIAFNDRPLLLQSPTDDHGLVRSSFGGLRASGHTAVGDAVNAAVHALRGLKTQNGRRPPGAIVLLSDGTSTNGADPVAAARQAGALGIPIYTVALGTSRGTIKVKRGARTVTVPVPLSGGELAQIASVSRGRAFTAADASGLRAVYAHLATKLGRKNVKQEITAGFAGAGLVLLLIASTLSLLWFGRLV